MKKQKIKKFTQGMSLGPGEEACLGSISYKVIYDAEKEKREDKLRWNKFKKRLRVMFNNIFGI